MKIALIRVNYHSHVITPPLGLGYISSYLKRKGHNVLIIDALKENLSNEKILEIINKHNINVIGLTCLSAYFPEVCTLSKILKNEQKTVIIGGVHPSFMPKQTLEESCADFIIMGEGELAFSKLLDNNFDNTDIKGVYSLNTLPKQPVLAEKIENLDELPFPDWTQINPSSYPPAPHGAVVKSYPIGIITTSRGCPYSCKFCASPTFYGKKIRFRSPQNVIDEIEYLIKEYKVKEIHFEDDNLTLNRNHIIEICNLIIEKNLKINLASPNGIRADKIDEELIILMKKAGWYYFAYGIESANKQILENANKLETIETINKAIELTAKHKISAQGFFIFGLPGETKETIKETINFAIKSKLARAQFTIFDVLPGCEFYKDLKGKFKPNFHKRSYQEPEWLPTNLTKQDLLNAQSTALRKFYLRPHILFNMIKLVPFSQIKYILKRLNDYGVTKKR